MLSEILELKANPERAAAGVIIEATLDRRRGPSATVLVQAGTLRVGDQIVAGSAWGRVRAIANERGETIDSIAPRLPGRGHRLERNTRSWRYPAGGLRRAHGPADRDPARPAPRHRQPGYRVTLDNIVKQIDAGDVKELVLVLKADVQGSVEAAVQSIENCPMATSRPVSSTPVPAR